LRVRAIRRFTVRNVLPDSLAPLDTLALNLRWSWHAPTRELFASLDPELWRRVHGDPVAMLGALSPRRLQDLATDEAVVGEVRRLDADLRTYLTEPRWFQQL